ncbi:unnamed protein product [Vicia faba]|uniref:Activator of Hsp90 ATPase AHSA1-like N-terminal domain-containing protein n=1 Tax=Vicia faba TaxID=3906 RepID=A0AAV0Z7Z0_VICFA|nr:unnamed protein product [Vicia faba]
MESGGEEKQQKPSYTYWVRKITEDAAPLPVHNKIDPSPPTSRSQPGSAWNRAGTWEEKSLNHWAIPRIKELLVSVGSISFSSGRAEVEDVTKCVGDALVVVVRNKKRVSFTYELSLRVKGEWIIQGNKKLVGGQIDVPEISFGELDDLQVEVRLNEASDISPQDKIEIYNNLKLFLQPIREKLLQFEQEIKDR